MLLNLLNFIFAFAHLQNLRHTQFLCWWSGERCYAHCARPNTLWRLIYLHTIDSQSIPRTRGTFCIVNVAHVWWIFSPTGSGCRGWNTFHTFYHDISIIFFDWQCFSEYQAYKCCRPHSQETRHYYMKSSGAAFCARSRFCFAIIVITFTTKHPMVSLNTDMRFILHRCNLNLMWHASCFML